MKTGAEYTPAEVMRMWKNGLIITIILILLFSGTSTANWGYSNHDAQNTSSTTENGPEPPLKFLWNPEKLRIGGDWLAPIVHGNVVYLVRSFRSPPFSVMAINISDGKVLWSTKGKEISTGAWSAFYMSGMIYIDTGWYNGVIECINATNGKVVWYMTGFFSANMVPTNRGIYFLRMIKNNKTSISTIKLVNPFTGEIKMQVPLIIANLSIYDTYIGIAGDVIYTYIPQELNSPKEYRSIYTLYAFNATTGNLIWKYDVKNYFSYLENSPMVVGRDLLYIPVWLNGSKYLEGGIAAINKTTGKLVWTRITDWGFGDFQYKFAYSPEYHIIVRINVESTHGKLIAIDSRDGHLVWTSYVNDSEYEDMICGNVVIAHNYIYKYEIAWKYPDDIYNATQVGLLRLYNVKNGKMVYQIEVPEATTGGTSTSLDLPDIAVSGGKVFIPDGCLSVLVHGNNSVKNHQPSTVLYGSILVATGLIAGTFFMIRKRKHSKEISDIHKNNV